MAHSRWEILTKLRRKDAVSNSECDDSVKFNWSTLLSQGVLAASCLYAMWHIHQSSMNWYLYLLSGVLSVYDSPVLALLGFFFIFLDTSFGIIRFVSTKPNSEVKTTSWFVSDFGLSFLTMYFNIAYENYSFAHLISFNLIIVTVLSWIIPSKLLKIVRHAMQAILVVSIITVTFCHQNWHGVLGAQLIAVATVSIGTEGTLFGFPATDAFYYILACAAYLLCRAITLETIT